MIAWGGVDRSRPGSMPIWGGCRCLAASVVANDTLVILRSEAFLTFKVLFGMPLGRPRALCKACYGSPGWTGRCLWLQHPVPPSKNVELEPDVSWRNWHTELPQRQYWHQSGGWRRMECPKAWGYQTLGLAQDAHRGRQRSAGGLGGRSHGQQDRWCADVAGIARPNSTLSAHRFIDCQWGWRHP